MSLPLTVQSLDEVFESQDLGLHAGLGKSVVVLNALQEMLEAPETVCFDALQSVRRQLRESVRLWILVTSCGRTHTHTYTRTNKQPHSVRLEVKLL